MSCSDCETLIQIAETITIIDKARKGNLIVVSDETYARLVTEALREAINKKVPVEGL